MLEAIIGSLLIVAALAVFTYARMPTRRGSDRMRRQALERYQRDVLADRPDDA